MNETIIYLLKVSAGLGIVFLPYSLFVRYDPNLSVKRFYLLAGLILAWIFPLISFSRPEMFVNLTPTVFIDLNSTEELPVSMAGTGRGITINWLQVLIITYVSGLIFMFLKNLIIILKWNITWRRSKYNDGIVFTDSDQVFTLFSRIFVPGKLKDKKDLDNVLLHEKAHIHQLHFFDLILMELTLLFTWFNPFSWLISRMIKENHEHLADRQVLSTGINPARYRAQLLNHTLGVNVFRLGNQFNHSLTLKRFKMMKKPRRSPMGVIKIALMIPAVLITMGLTTGMSPQDKTIKGKVVFAENGEPAPGAAIVISGTSMGTVADIDGSFMINVEGNPELVISFVGYSTLRVKSSKAGKKALVLEPRIYEMDLEMDPVIVPIMVKETDRGTVSMNTVVDDPDNPPVFVVNGKVVDNIDMLDSKSIESVSIIKDPDSEEARKYKASHVVLITMKGKHTPEEKEETDIPKVDSETFYVVEEMPSFPGGKAALKTYIYSKLEYPESALKKKVKGEVRVQFLVKYSGKLDDIKVVSSTHEELNKAALKVFKDMPDWKPGLQRGKRVQVNVVVPVRFNPDKK